MARQWVPIKERIRIWAMPCAICKRPDDIEVDHVIAVADGGGSELTNLQPLCRVCNVLKRHLKTNEAVDRWINENPAEYRKRQEHRTRRAELKMKGEWF